MVLQPVECASRGGVRIDIGGVQHDWRKRRVHIQWCVYLIIEISQFAAERNAVTEQKYGCTGSNIFVFGSVVDPGSSSPPVSMYSVDGGSPTTFTAPQTTGRQDVVQFFRSSNMPLTNHTLTINITNASPGAPYYLDYLQFNIDVLPLSSSVAPTSSASATSSSLSSSPPADSTTASASPSATTSAAAETKQTAATGAIVGGVVGGLAVLFMIIGALYWRRNRRPSGEFRYGTKAHQGECRLDVKSGSRLTNDGRRCCSRRCTIHDGFLALVAWAHTESFAGALHASHRQ